LSLCEKTTRDPTSDFACDSSDCNHIPSSMAEVSARVYDARANYRGSRMSGIVVLR